MLLSATPVLGATQVLHTSFKGQFARAIFDSVDPTGCIHTIVDVFAIDRKDKVVGQPAATSETIVFIDVADVCASTGWIVAFGSGTPDRFDMHGLDEATLDTTIEMFDFVSGTTFTVNVDVTWASIGEPIRTKSRLIDRSPGFFFSSKFDGTFRSATAVGTVSDGSTDFTPDQAVVASLDKAKSAELTVAKE